MYIIFIWVKEGIRLPPTHKNANTHTIGIELAQTDKIYQTKKYVYETNIYTEKNICLLLVKTEKDII